MELNKEQILLYTGKDSNYTKYNRSEAQCNMLFSLLNGDIKLYEEYECASKYLNLFYCASSIDETHWIISKYRVRKYIDELFWKYVPNTNN